MNQLLSLATILNYFDKQTKYLEAWIMQRAGIIARIVLLNIGMLVVGLLAWWILAMVWHRLFISHSPHTPTQHKSIQSAKLISPTQSASKPPTTIMSGNTAHWYDVKIKSNDSPIRVFKQLGLSIQSLHTILALGKETAPLMELRPGQIMRFLITDQHKLVQLIYPLSLTNTLYVTHTFEGFYARTEHRQLEEKLTYSAATIHHSLFSCGYKVGLSDKLIMGLTNIFGWDIDFAKDLRPNDSFKVMYKSYYLDANKVREGKILAAEFTNRGKTYRAIAFTDPTGNTHYYTPQGISLQRPFLRTPVKYTRISSRFQSSRYHPILHLIRAHHGVDYAAPYGTPIHSTSDGKIVFIGRRGGYGNVIIIEHGNKYSTLYGHMAYFAKGMKKHLLIHQGQIIGYVGKTGLATGNHLHYEFRINNVHHNPLTVKLPDAHPILPKYYNAFLKQAKLIMAQFTALSHEQVHKNNV